MPAPSSFFKRSFVLLVLVLFTVFWTSKFWQSRAVIEWDVTLYYSYLPATFIYHDYDIYDSGEEEWGKRQFYMNQDAEGHRYVKMTAGLSMLYSPFFLAAHSFAQNSAQFEANGFSEPYRYALLISALIFALGGLYCLGRFLRFYFSDKVAALAMLCIFTGTNLPYYSFVEPMSHVYSFALVSFILLQTQLYLGRQKMVRALLIGLAAGLLVLIRPTNITALIFPILLIIHSFRNINTRQLWQHLTLTLAVAVLPLLPQFIYWKHMTGHWLLYSYNDESFFFSDPEIWKGLFSYRKGWFTYSPILFVALLGLVALYRRYRHLLLGVLLTLIPTLWITFSWWCWWYGGSFGSRPMIEFLPFMALGLATAIEFLTDQKRWLQWGGGVLVFFLCFWSVFMNKQYKSSIIHYDSMSKELYWDQFLIDHFVEDYEKKLDPADYEAAKVNAD